MVLWAHRYLAAYLNFGGSVKGWSEPASVVGIINQEKLILK